MKITEETWGDMFDARPSIGATTPEPCLREIVRQYYQGSFSNAVSEDLTQRYFAALIALETGQVVNSHRRPNSSRKTFGKEAS